MEAKPPLRIAPTRLSMSRTVHLIGKNVPGYGTPDGRCLPCLGVSRRALTRSPCLSYGDHRIRSLIKIGSLTSASAGVSFVCKASSSGHGRNPDLPMRNRRGNSKNRNRQNEESDDFENSEEPEILSPKNGSIFSKTPKFQATTPGPKDGDVLELFRNVQAQLRERAATKQEKKIEAPKEQGKDSETVDSLLKLLRKYSTERDKKSKGGSRDIMDKSAQNGKALNGSAFISNSTGRDGSQASYAPSVRPQSKFIRKSPVRREKSELPNSGGGAANRWTSSERKKKNQVDPLPDPEEESEMDSDLESEPEPETEAIFSDGDVYDDSLKDVNAAYVIEGEEEQELKDVNAAYVTEGGEGQELLDVNAAYVAEGGEEQQPSEQEDLRGMKLPELRALAKSRGLKGISKMKKRELIDFLISRSS